MKIYYSTDYKSPIGDILLGADDSGLVGLWFYGEKYFKDTVTGEFIVKNNLSVLKDATKWLDDYFSGNKPPINALALAPNGGEFRQIVWDILKEIPYGEIVTYGEVAVQVAKRLGKEKMSAQAVGGAVGHNPISIVIPCHRVVGATGSLTGYAGGLDKKISLLTHEGADMSGLFVPNKGTAL